MKKKLATLALLLCALTAIQAVAQSATQTANQSTGNNNDLSVLLTEGDVDLSFRYRYEFVDQDSLSQNANASTVRTRLSLQSGEFRDFDFFLEFDDVREVIWDDFNAGGGNTPGRGEYPVVADVEGTEVNQAYVDYNGLDKWGFRLGRQRINLDNQRFIGGVGWRQQEQTFDSVRVNWDHEWFDANYTYVDRVRTIFGEDVSAGKDKQDNTHLINVSGETPIGKLVGYYYHYDSEDRETLSGGAIGSTGSAGARLTGRYPINEDWKLRYEAEFASQSDVGNNPNNLSAEYYHVDVGALFGIYDFGVGWEVLTGDDSSADNEAFQTPLATLHAFNGWADQFLTTPGAGLDDRYVKFKATPGKFIIDVRYHDFEAESGGTSYGDELDLRAGYSFNKKFRADLYYANFSGSNSFQDVTKFWAMVTLAL